MPDIHIRNIPEQDRIDFQIMCKRLKISGNQKLKDLIKEAVQKYKEGQK